MKVIKFYFLIIFVLGSVPHFAQALSLTTIPQNPLVFCGSCETNEASLIEIDAAEMKDGEWLEIKVTHQGGLTFSSGFPFMNGAVLLNARLPVENGKVSFKTHFPIRGVYRVLMTSKHQTLSQDIKVKEPAAVQIRVVTLFAVMLLLGLLCGFIFGRASVRALVALLFVVLMSPAGLEAHQGESHVKSKAGVPRDRVTDAWKTFIKISPDPPIVGSAAQLSLHILNAKTGAPLKAAWVKVTIDLLEYQLTIFETKTRVVDGVVDLSYGYFDGSTHRVTYAVVPDSPQQAPFTVSFENEVQAKAPPPGDKFATVGFLMLVMAIGFVVGFIFGAQKESSPGALA